MVAYSWGVGYETYSTPLFYLGYIMSEKKKPEIIFAPGCFDDFDGTQEELVELVAELNRMVESGELFDLATPVDFADGTWTDEEIEKVSVSFDNYENTGKRTLN